MHRFLLISGALFGVMLFVSVLMSAAQPPAPKLPTPRPTRTYFGCFDKKQSVKIGVFVDGQKLEALAHVPAEEVDLLPYQEYCLGSVMMSILEARSEGGLLLIGRIEGDEVKGCLSMEDGNEEYEFTASLSGTDALCGSYTVLGHRMIAFEKSEKKSYGKKKGGKSAEKLDGKFGGKSDARRRAKLVLFPDGSIVGQAQIHGRTIPLNGKADMKQSRQAILERMIGNVLPAESKSFGAPVKLGGTLK